MGIVLKSSREIAKMREAGKVVHAVLDAVEAACLPGVSTLELDRIAERVLDAGRGALGLPGLPARRPAAVPAVLCTSVNDVVVHGIPRRDVVLAEGDIVGHRLRLLQGRLLRRRRPHRRRRRDQRARRATCSPPPARRSSGPSPAASPVAACEDIGAAIQGLAESRGYSVVRELVGHGIGRAMHEPPEVRNYGTAGRGLRLAPGLVIAIEPMVNAGGPAVRTLDDGWTIVTDDRSLSAHFEHTVAITDDGPQVLTVA